MSTLSVVTLKCRVPKVASTAAVMSLEASSRARTSSARRGGGASWKELEMPSAASMGSDASLLHRGAGSRPLHSRKPCAMICSGCVLRRGRRSETRDMGGGGPLRSGGARGGARGGAVRGCRSGCCRPGCCRPGCCRPDCCRSGCCRSGCCMSGSTLACCAQGSKTARHWRWRWRVVTTAGSAADFAGGFAGGFADSPLTRILTADSSAGGSAGASRGDSASGWASSVLTGSGMLSAVIGHT